MKLTRNFALILAFGIATGNAAAQIHTHWSLHAVTAIPMGGLADNIKSIGIGLGGFAGISADRWPVIVGVEGSVTRYGLSNELEPVDPSVSSVISPAADFARYSLATVHLLVRAHRNQHVLGPYVEGLVGIKRFFTEAGPDDRGLKFPKSMLALGSLHSDKALSYGVGGGLNIRPFRGSSRWVQIHLGARYLLGGRAEYVINGGVKRTTKSYVYTTRSSRTGTLMTELGFSLHF